MEQEKTKAFQEDSSASQILHQLRQRAREGTLREVFSDWKWIFTFSHGRRGRILAYTLFGIFSGLVGLVSGVLGKYLVDAIVARSTRQLLLLAVMTVVTTAVSLALRSLASRFSARLSVDMHNDVQAKTFDALLRSSWSEISRFPTGELLSRLSGDVSTVSGCAVSWMPNVCIHCVTLAASVGVVLYYDPIMALIAFASTPALLFASRRLLRRQRSFNQKLRTVSGGMSSFQADTFRNADTLKSFGVEASMTEKLSSWQEKLKQVTLEFNAFTIRTNLWLTVLSTGVQFLAVSYCLWRLWRGDILLGTMVLFLQQRSTLSGAFSSLISLIPTALSGSVAAERLRQIIELEKEPATGECPQPEGSCAVELQSVRVSYSDDRRTVLSDVNITVEAGSVAALVGPSGEGKSTLMRLLLGLVPPEEGRAFLTDAAGNQIPLGADTRKLLAYVPQGNTMLSGTVADNLRLVKPDVTEQEMICALEDACAWDFVRELPLGLDQPIGEGGKGLSEGQAQRIAIARALVRKAPVLLLDEVTSALDHETEQKVLKNLTGRGVTCIAATHRPSVLGMCARIYRVREGRVELLSDEFSTAPPELHM